MSLGRELSDEELLILRSARRILDPLPDDPMRGETVQRQIVADLLRGIIERESSVTALPPEADQ